MKLKEDLSIKEMKELINEIIEEEKQKYQIEIKINPITIGEYYQTDTLRKILKIEKNPIKKFNKLTAPITKYGWYDPKSKNTFISLNKYKKMNYVTRIMVIVMTSYHEARHNYQDEIIKTNNYEALLMQIERNIINKNRIHYKLNHDNYLTEIDANIYAIDKTIEYLKKHPKIYINIKNLLAICQEKYYQDLTIYDAYSLFEKINSMIKSNSNKILEEIKILNYFYSKDGNFKSLTEILDNKHNIDEKILELILSSRPFLNSLDFTKLTFEEFKYIVSTIERTYQNELKRKVKLEKYKIENTSNSILYLNKYKKNLQYIEYFINMLYMITNYLDTKTEEHLEKQDIDILHKKKLNLNK